MISVRGDINRIFNAQRTKRIFMFAYLHAYMRDCCPLSGLLDIVDYFVEQRMPLTDYTVRPGPSLSVGGVKAFSCIPDKDFRRLH